MSADPIEILRGWISTGALIGLLTLASRLWISNRKLRMQEKIEDRQGFGELITAMNVEMARLRVRVETLERERDTEHKLIVELLRQTNRTQAVSIMARSDVSPELRHALESTIDATEMPQ